MDDEKVVAPEARKLTDGYPKRFANGYSFEMDERGDFRIVDPMGMDGGWVWYQGIAMSHDGRFLAVSEYFSGPMFNAETLYRLTEVPVEMENPVEMSNEQKLHALMFEMIDSGDLAEVLQVIVDLEREIR